MLRLRKILLSNFLYIIIVIIVIIISVLRIYLKEDKNYQEENITYEATIIKYSVDGNTTTIYLKNEALTIGKYYFKSQKERKKFENNIGIGDKIKITGELKIPQGNTTKNLFNYKKYLSYKNIFYIVKINSYKKVSENKNIYYSIKQKIKNHLHKNPYLYTFILGDKSYLSTKAISSYQENGISHLFAISGMHITLLSSIIFSILKKINLTETNKYIITSIFLLMYLLIAETSPSIFRGVLFFILFSINKLFYFNILPKNIFLLVLSIVLLINPFSIFDLGFQYSFLISYYLIKTSKQLQSKSYLISLLKVSLISFFVSIPITINSFYQLNLLSIIYNLLFVPFVSIIVFPLSLITIIIPIVEPLYNFVTYSMEQLSIFLSNISTFKIVFMKLPFYIYIIYFILIDISLKKFFQKKYLLLLITIFILLIHSNLHNFNNKVYLEVIDVGQGDSSLLVINDNITLIDTGGILTYQEKWEEKVKESSIVKTTTIPLIKSMGIKKINNLILTHGDYDHMGEAINLVNNFKVEKVIFNCGEFNQLEQDLIKVLDKKKIPYYSCIKELNIDNNKLYFLNNKDYGNENDNSSVIYTELNNNKFLFMGDAGVGVEEDLIKKYNLKDIDVLKVGHHGSKTSSSEEFINNINPKYSIISAGKNNRYGHPNKDVLNNLEDSKTYRTDQDGSIMFKLKNNKLEIETCTP